MSVSLSCLPACEAGVLWPNGWMDQDATCCGDGPRPRPDCVIWGPNPTPERGTVALPSFRPIYCVQMVAHLSYC